MSSSYLEQAIGGIVFYDVTSKESLEKALIWADNLEKASKNGVIMLLGNKVDICQNDPSMRKVETEYAKLIADQRNFLFFETSALNKENVSLAFEKLAEG